MTALTNAYGGGYAVLVISRTYLEEDWKFLLVSWNPADKKLHGKSKWKDNSGSRTLNLSVPKKNGLGNSPIAMVMPEEEPAWGGSLSSNTDLWNWNRFQEDDFSFRKAGTEKQTERRCGTQGSGPRRFTESLSVFHRHPIDPVSMYRRSHIPNTQSHRQQEK